MKYSAEKLSKVMDRTLLIPVIAIAIISQTYAGVWDENYIKGQKAVERGDWTAAINYFTVAINDNPKPEQQAPLPNTSVIDYFPYYYLGRAYFYSGNYQLAKDNFLKEQQFGVINRTSIKRELERLIEITNILIQSTNPPPAAKVSVDLERDFTRLQNLIAVKNYFEANNLLAQIKSREFEDQRISVFERWIQASLRESTDVPKVEPVNEAEQFYNKGLNYFLRGDFEQALRSFQSAAASDPNFTVAKNWINKTQSEINRLSSEKNLKKEQPLVIEKVDTTTTVPSIYLSVRDGHETSRKKLILTGEARDDRGVAFIEVRLNGKTLQNAQREDVVIRPGTDDDPKRFSFSLTILLQMDENQLTLTAYDFDSSDPTVEQITIFRIQPFYQTTVFAVILASVILLGVGAVVITKRVKYRLAIVNKYNPYIAGSPIRNEEMFFGREKLIKRILNTLHNNSLMLHGQRRIGKTSLQHQLKRRLENLNDREFQFVPVLIDLQGTTEERFFQTIIEDILETCKSDLDGSASFHLHENGQEYSSRDFSSDLKTVLQTLNAKSEKKLKLVLLIDEVDELNKYSEQVNQKLRSVFMKTFAENLVAVMSGISIKKHWQSEGSPWYNFFEEIEVPPFEREDALNLIRQPVTGIFSYDDRAVEKIIEYSECKPFIIQKFCANVIHRIIELKRRWVTVEDVEAVRAQVLKAEPLE